MKLRLLLGMLVVGMATACGGGDDGGNGGGGGEGGGGGVVTFELEEQNGSGKTATVNLERGIGTTELTLEITPPSGTENADIHVHKAACEDVTGDTEVAHEVGFVTAGLGQGSIFVALDEIATGEYVIDIHNPKSPDETLVCGQIPEQ